MKVFINGSCISDNAFVKPQPVIPEMNEKQKSLLKRILPEAAGMVIAFSTVAIAPNPSVAVTAMAADPSQSLIVKEQTIIHLLQGIGLPAAIAIAIWGLIEWAILQNPKGKKKIWDSLWLLVGLKFIPDIWTAVAG